MNPSFLSERVAYVLIRDVNWLKANFLTCLVEPGSIKLSSLMCLWCIKNIILRINVREYMSNFKET